MAAPAERLPGPHGTLSIGKIAEFRVESAISWIPGSAFCLLSAPPIYGVFVYLAPPLWVLGVNAQPRGASPGAPAEPNGTLRIGKMAELRLQSGILWGHEAAFCFSFFATQSTLDPRPHRVD